MNRRRTLAAAGLALAVGASLAGCALFHAPDHGIVHDRDFEPAHTTTTTICNSVGKVLVCTPVTNYVDDSWSLDVYASKDDHGWVDVDHATFDRCQIGDEFARGTCS